MEEIAAERAELGRVLVLAIRCENKLEPVAWRRDGCHTLLGIARKPMRVTALR
jgi:hypothetical protein